MIYIYTFYTDESRIKYLEESALINNITITYLKNNSWNGYVDKIIAVNNIIDKHDDTDIICFIDAYDVLINNNLDSIIDEFKVYNCDLLIGAELNCYPYKYINSYPKIDSKYKYVNSGGYIGYKHALKKLFQWKTNDDIYRICADGGDQSYFTEYFISNHCDKIKLDINCKIFQNMHLVSWNELIFEKGKVYNTIMKTIPSFIHFNGGTWQQNNHENIMPIFIEKMKYTMENQCNDNLNNYSQIITSTCFPHPQI